MRRARHGGHRHRARTSGWTAAFVVALIALGGGTAALAAEDPVALEAQAAQAAARAQQLQQAASLAQAAAIAARSTAAGASAEVDSAQSAFSAAGTDAQQQDEEADDLEAGIAALRAAANARDAVADRAAERDQAQATFNAAPTPENQAALDAAQGRLDAAEERADELTAAAGQAPDTPAAAMRATADGRVDGAATARQEAIDAAQREADAQAALEAAQVRADGLDRTADDAEEDFRDAKAAADRATADATTLTLRAREARAAATAAGTPAVVTPARAAFLTPFPIVRIRGRLTSRGAVITLLSVRAPRGARVAVTCTGGTRRGCPRGLRARTAAAVSFPAVKRHLRAGAALEVRVTRSGTIGKYTRFTIRKGRSPVRRDSCLLPGRSKPSACPSK